MRFFIDFEATQPQNEIISVGVITDEGDSFHRYVKPVFSNITPYITQLTHITEQDLNEANVLDIVFSNLYSWLKEKEPNICNWEFVVFGSGDEVFIKTSAAALKTNEAKIVAGLMLLNLVDYSKKAQQFFRGNISLIKAFNYIQQLEQKQKHDALEDALMLRKVVQYIDNEKPLDRNPFANISIDTTIKMPSGVFYARRINGGGERCLGTIEDAIDFFIKEQGITNPEEVHRDRIMKNIMKSVRTKKSYAHYKWMRIKEESTDE